MATLIPISGELRCSSGMSVRRLVCGATTVVVLSSLVVSMHQVHVLQRQLEQSHESIQKQLSELAEHRAQSAAQLNQLVEHRSQSAALELKQRAQIGEQHKIIEAQRAALQKKQQTPVDATEAHANPPERLGSPKRRLRQGTVLAKGSNHATSGCISLQTTDATAGTPDTITFDMNSATCSNSARCPPCFLAHTLTDDLVMTIQKCSTARVSTTAVMGTTATDVAMMEFVFMNYDDNKYMAITDGTNTYRLAPGEMVVAYCWSGGTNLLAFPDLSSASGYCPKACDAETPTDRSGSAFSTVTGITAARATKLNAIADAGTWDANKATNVYNLGNAGTGAWTATTVGYAVALVGSAWDADKVTNIFNLGSASAGAWTSAKSGYMADLAGAGTWTTAIATNVFNLGNAGTGAWTGTTVGYAVALVGSAWDADKVTNIFNLGSASAGAWTSAKSGYMADLAGAGTWTTAIATNVFNLGNAGTGAWTGTTVGYAVALVGSAWDATKVSNAFKLAQADPGGNVASYTSSGAAAADTSTNACATGSDYRLCIR
eukprot:TRINITY_DN2129_c0_g1_i1.p1 TRINITY_DN2129_c0_g1~~TRINITY_DN2129_c0_g1_i1.p1  ORF type:complete len:547 (-),score=70.27 TRINITY_DN2129_c0_g1_i1:118-1758(-)